MEVNLSKLSATFVLVMAAIMSAFLFVFDAAAFDDQPDKAKPAAKGSEFSMGQYEPVFGEPVARGGL